MKKYELDNVQRVHWANKLLQYKSKFEDQLITAAATGSGGLATMTLKQRPQRVGCSEKDPTWPE